MIDISVGIKLFNESDYFSAHDFFEDLWMNADHNEKEFFQGLVQISVGCYHLICGNMKGAESQLTKGKNKLIKFEPNFYRIDLVTLNSKINFLLKNLTHLEITNKIPIIELTT